ncbi:MAG: hypothetical protein IPP86_11970 [Bacteroidetes bacterium]|nr:hypothetical protein [Bacteroidota bacterium]
MANLFWTPKGKKTIELITKPFGSEQEFEEFVFNNEDILQGITILNRQIRGGRKPGIPDMVGIDEDGNVCVIEMKNVTVDEKILPQVLAYAIWAKSNPDAIKNLWHELDLDDDLNVNWDNYEVRIIVIAPEINPVALNYISSIQYDVDFVEIKRWIHKKDIFLSVDYLEQIHEKKTGPTKGLEIYDKAFYEKSRNKKSVVEFLGYVREMEQLLKKKNIKLEKRFNKHYCGFKYGFNTIFSIAWLGSKSFGFRLRMPESELKKVKVPGIEMVYARGEGRFKITPGKTKASTFLPLIKKAIGEKTEE